MIVRPVLFATLLGVGACGGANSTDATNADVNQHADQNRDTMDGGIAASCQPGQPDPRACDPNDTKKTTVCHIPPGNPANEHTICVGNAAVPAHLAHGDHLGSCCATMTPPTGNPPPPPGNPPPPPGNPPPPPPGNPPPPPNAPDAGTPMVG